MCILLSHDNLCAQAWTAAHWQAKINEANWISQVTQLTDTQILIGIN